MTWWHCDRCGKYYESILAKELDKVYCFCGKGKKRMMLVE